MSGHGEKLTRKQEAAIAALLSKPTIEKAAKACGIGEATLRRWLKDEGFQERYRAAKKQTLDAVMGRLRQIAGEAVETLREVAVNQEAPPSSRIAAARAVLDMVIKVVEAEEVEDRLTAVEKAVLTRNRR
jgi:hypothetical protein